MKLYTIGAVAIALATSLVATAQTAIQSEYFYQAPTDANVFTPGVEYTSSTTKIKGVSNAQKLTGPTLNLTYERGITEDFAAGLTVGYANQSVEAAGSTKSQTSSGLTDLNIFAKGAMAFTEGSSAHYGVNLVAALENQKVETSGDTNAATGGMYISPYIGYQWAVGAGAVGTRLSTELLKTAKSERNNVTTTTEEGTTTQLTGFYEMKMDTTKIDFEARYTLNADKKDKETGFKTGVPNYIGLAVIPTFAINESTTVLGSLSYDKILDSKISEETSTGTQEYEIENGDILAINIGGRFTF